MTLTDTSAEAERVWIATWRRLSPARKWQILGEAFTTARMLDAAEVRHRRPQATPAEIHADWLLTQYGFVAPPQEGSVMNSDPRALQVVREVLDVLGKLGIPHALGGSVASSFHGIARYTQDADVTVEPFPGKETPFVAAFGPDYSVSLPAIEQAVRDRSGFSILNRREGFKVDVLVLEDSPFEQKAMERRVAVTLPDRPAEPVLMLTAEDILLLKFVWYRLGGEASDRQWSDILGVLRVQAGHLDEAYLDRWAADLGVSDLLARARQERGAPG